MQSNRSVTRNPCNKKACLVGGCSPQKQLILQSIKLLWWILISLHLICHKNCLKKSADIIAKGARYSWMVLPYVSEIQYSFPLMLLPPACCTWLASHIPLTVCCIATWTRTLQCLIVFHTHSCSPRLSEHPDFSLQVQICSVRKASVDTFKFVVAD
jgi:hypothetical protein